MRGILNLTEGFGDSFGAFRIPIKCTSFIFNGGEIHFKLLPFDDKGYEIDEVLITSRVNNTDDLMKIILAKDALEREGVKRFELLMPYVPYARQDRVCNAGEAFSLKVFTNILNSCKFDKVIVLDAHSDVAPALIDNCENLTNFSYVSEALEYLHDTEFSDIILISPDSGANKKTNKLYDYFPESFSGLVKCDKRRDLATGKLDGFEVFVKDLGGFPCLIVDDICDGGRTFTGLAQELKRLNAGDLFLFVTHGIFSNGFEELQKDFKRIFTTDSVKSVNHPLVKQFKV